MSPRLATDQWRATVAAATATGLASLCLTPTLTGGGWWTACATVIVVVALVGGGSRAIGLPGWLVVLLQGAALAMALTALFAQDVAVLGALPGPGSWPTFDALLAEAVDVVYQDVAPVPVSDGIRFLVVAGVGLVAWVVDAVAVTWQRATLAGVPLLSLYLVPALALPDGVPWPLFLVAGIGWLLLLLTDGRRELARWGRPVEPSRAGLHSVGGTGRRLGAAALAVAVVVPVLLPSLEDGRFGTGGTAGDGPGTGDGKPTEQRVLTVNPLADLQRNLTRGEDAPVLAYATDATAPQYLRLATLDQFNGTTWTLEEMEASSAQQASRGVGAPPGLSDTVAVTDVPYAIEVGPLDTPRLPLPYPVSVVDIEGDWRWDAQTLDVFSAEEGGTALGQQYVASHLAVEPTTAQLRGAAEPAPEMISMLTLPDDVDAYLTPIAVTVAGAEPTAYDQALALQNWFRSRFSYSLDRVEGNSTGALKDFLDDRSGYCEQFAAAMALMARALGIPSRVQVGFTPGEQLEDGTWEVTLHDAHAWPELWFEGVGWVRFEPTPGGGDGSGAPAYAPVPVSERTGTGNGGEGRGVVLRRGGGPISDEIARRNQLRDVLEANRGRGAFGAAAGETSAPPEEGSQLWLWLALVMVAALVAVAPVTASRMRRRARWRAVRDPAAAVHATWADILDTAGDVDLAPAPTETPRDLAARLPRRAGLSRGRTQELVSLAHSVELLRYRGDVADLPSVVDLRARGDALRAELLAMLSPGDRRRAVWWPRSGRVALAEWWNQGMETVAQIRGRASDRVLRRRPRAGAPSALRSGS